MKFNVAYVKQHPVMFGAIFVVFGLFLWILLNRNGGGATVVTTSGATDPNALAASVQLQGQQIASARDIQLAQFSLAANSQQLDSNERIATLELQAQLADQASQERQGASAISASVDALHAQLDNALAITQANNGFQVDYARQANDAATTQLLIGAALQRDLSAQQLQAYKVGAAYSAVSLFKKKDAKLAALADATSVAGGMGTNFGFTLPPPPPVAGNA